MEGGDSPDLGDIGTRRDYLFGAGSIAVLSGMAGCLGFGGGDQQAERSESETGTNDSPDGETEDDENGDVDDDDDESDDVDEDEGDEADEAEDDVDLSDDDSSDEVEEEDEDELEDDDDEEREGEGGEDDADEDDSDSGQDDEVENDDSNDDEDDGESDGDDSSDDEEEDDETSDDEDRFDQFRLEEVPYQVDYPADWEISGGEEVIKIHNADDTAWLLIDIRDARLDLDAEIRAFREDFEPNPDVEIHADDSVTLASGEDGHRFIIEMSGRDGHVYAHELLAQANGYHYRTVVVVSQSIYNEEYMELAEELLSTVTLQ